MIHGRKPWKKLGVIKSIVHKKSLRNVLPEKVPYYEEHNVRRLHGDNQEAMKYLLPLYSYVNTTDDDGGLNQTIELPMITDKMRRPYEGELPAALTSISKNPKWQLFLCYLIVAPHLDSSGAVSYASLDQAIEVAPMQVNRILKQLQKHKQIECVDPSFSKQAGKAMKWLASSELLELHKAYYASAKNGGGSATSRDSTRH